MAGGPQKLNSPEKALLDAEADKIRKLSVQRVDQAERATTFLKDNEAAVRTEIDRIQNLPNNVMWLVGGAASMTPEEFSKELVKCFNDDDPLLRDSRYRVLELWLKEKYSNKVTLVIAGSPMNGRTVAIRWNQ
jgi:hypothetical protein